MNVSLKIKSQSINDKGESPLFVRLRKPNSDGKMEETSITTSVDLLPKHFKNGNISPRTSEYLFKQKMVTTILSDLNNIISGIQEEGLIPNPSLVKKRYLDLSKVKEDITPQYKSFWKSFDEFFETKKHKTRGYRKTFITLRNRLKEFESHRKTIITFDYVIGNTLTFQHKLQDYFWEHKKLSNGYVNKLLENLSLFLYYSFQQGYIHKKPKFKKNDIIERDEKIYLYKNEVIKLFQSTKWDYKEGKSFDNNHIYIIEDSLEGTRKDEFGGVNIITNWELVKDIFLFQCSIGCRYSDIPHFKVRHFNFDKDTQSFTWVQQKTDKRVSVPVNPISGSIFQKYSRGKSLSQSLFPKLSNQKFNKTLKYLLEDLKFNRLVSYPRKIGSTIVNSEDRFLWELISSHGGRRTFIKNMIDLGTMDIKTVMTLSGHKTYSEFEKYVSVSPHDIQKGRKLYLIDDPKTDDEVEDMVKIYLNLNDEERKMVFQLMKTLMKKS